MNLKLEMIRGLDKCDLLNIPKYVDFFLKYGTIDVNGNYILQWNFNSNYNNDAIDIDEFDYENKCEYNHNYNETTNLYLLICAHVNDAYCFACAFGCKIIEKNCLQLIKV